MTQTEVQLDPQGRLVIPAPLRRSLGFESGDSLIARMEDGRLILEKAETIKQRLKSRFSQLSPGTTNLAEELIAERREEAKREIKKVTVVLDASALLSFLQSEPGDNQVEVMLPEAVICSVNWSEVVQKSVAAGVDVDGMREDLEALGLKILPFSAEEAELAGRLWQQTKQAGLSLGDRACLSTGIRMNVNVLTADQIWTTLNLPVVVQSIR